jgi:hypothetical protein
MSDAGFRFRSCCPSAPGKALRPTPSCVLGPSTPDPSDIDGAPDAAWPARREANFVTDPVLACPHWGIDPGFKGSLGLPTPRAPNTAALPCGCPVGDIHDEVRRGQLAATNRPHSTRDGSAIVFFWNQTQFGVKASRADKTASAASHLVDQQTCTDWPTAYWSRYSTSSRDQLKPAADSQSRG